MLVNNEQYRTIWLDSSDDRIVNIIDQRHLPHRFVIEKIQSCEQMAQAIKDMHLRGAGLIGAAAAWGVYLAMIECNDRKDCFERKIELLRNTRPTAANLFYALDRMKSAIENIEDNSRRKIRAKETAQLISDEDAAACQKIGTYGLEIIRAICNSKNGNTVNILTHCNAGWLAFVDFGSATAPIYAAHNAGIAVHVWVDETRPRNQGARLTAWELKEHGIPHTIIADNVGGHLMQHGKVDLVLTGTDRTAANGDVANKIGTYLKALAAKDNDIPFYVALPTSTFDVNIQDGLKEIPIEERSPDEVHYIQGWDGQDIKRIRLTPMESPAANYAFDVTPARLITGLITELGICAANEKSIKNLLQNG